nr:MFS transporter [Alphaproteobacteria bacterium]
MFRLVFSVWPLMLGILLMLVSHGLFSLLLTLRASLEEYSSSTIGIIILAYPVGMIVAAHIAPKLVSNVGHIRVFAAFTSIASAATLVAALYVDASWWTLLRLILGFTNTGLYIVSESWLNAAATNETRGKLLSVYMVVQYVAYMIGSYLVNLASPESFTLFILSSVLLSFALLPMLLTRIANPVVPDTENMSLRDLWKSSPSAVIMPFFVGLMCFTLLSMTTVFANKSGYTTLQVSLCNIML